MKILNGRGRSSTSTLHQLIFFTWIKCIFWFLLQMFVYLHHSPPDVDPLLRLSVSLDVLLFFFHSSLHFNILQGLKATTRGSGRRAAPVSLWAEIHDFSLWSLLWQIVFVQEATQTLSSGYKGLCYSKIEVQSNISSRNGRTPTQTYLRMGYKISAIKAS